MGGECLVVGEPVREGGSYRERAVRSWSRQAVAEREQQRVEAEQLVQVEVRVVLASSEHVFRVDAGSGVAARFQEAVTRACRMAGLERNAELRLVVGPADVAAAEKRFERHVQVTEEAAQRRAARAAAEAEQH